MSQEEDTKTFWKEKNEIELSSNKQTNKQTKQNKTKQKNNQTNFLLLLDDHQAVSTELPTADDGVGLLWNVRIQNVSVEDQF